MTGVNPEGAEEMIQARDRGIGIRRGTTALIKCMNDQVRAAYGVDIADLMRSCPNAREHLLDVLEDASGSDNYESLPVEIRSLRAVR